MLNLGLKLNNNRVGGDANVSAFLAATGLTGTTEVAAVRQLVANLKSYGLWSKMKAIYPFVSDTVNLLSYSQDFANAYWSKNTTITANATTAPDGTNTGTQTSGAGNIYTLSPTLSAQQYTVSVYAKANTSTSFELNIVTAGFGLGFKCSFNLSTGTAGAVTNYGGLSGTATITNAGNGWYRCTLSGVLTAAQYYYQLTTTANALYIWGSQLEQASSASIYQVITTTPAARFVSQFKYNLKDPRDLDAAFRLSFNGTWTYAKTGATPNGVNGYINSFFKPSNSTYTDFNFGHYITTNSNGVYAEFGINQTNTYVVYDYPNLSGTGYIRYGSSDNTYTASSTLGFSSYNQSSNQLKRFKNGVLANTFANTPANLSLSTLTYYFGARNVDGTAGQFSNRTRNFHYMSDGLTDTEATNLYTSVQLFQQALARYVGVPIVSDSNAQAFLDAAVITDQTQADAVNTLVTDLKGYGIWSKMKAIYPFVGGTATTHKWNLKDPRDLDAAYRLAFSGAWTHSSTGAAPNGTNAYADTFLTPSTALGLDNTHISYYSRTNNSTNGVEMGVLGYLATSSLYLLYSYSGTAYKALNRVQSIGGSVYTPTTGLLIGNRASSTTEKYYHKGTLIDTLTVSSSALPINKIYLAAYNNNTLASEYSTKQTAFATIGDGLSDTEASNLYTAVQKYQTSLSRQV